MALRTVMVGCGGITGAWFNATKERDDIEYVGLVDINEDAAKEKAEKHELTDVVIGTDLAAVLEQTKPDIVFNCTIPEAHCDVVLTALEHSCHVLEEKPLANSMDEARRMVAAAEKAGKVFAVIQNRRYNPQIRRLRAFIESGAIGKVTTVNGDFYIGAHFGGFRAEMDHVLLLDMAIHSFDAARLISGADPLNVYCHEWNPAGSWYNHGASAVAVYQMTDDIVYTYRGSWCSEGFTTEWECEWRIVGEKGTVTWDGADTILAQTTKDEDKGIVWSSVDHEVPEPAPTKMMDSHKGNIDEFIACLPAGIFLERKTSR